MKRNSKFFRNFKKFKTHWIRELKNLEFENLKIIWDILLCGIIEKKNLKLYLGNKQKMNNF